MKKVLIVDDDPAFTFELEQLLKEEFQVETNVEAMSALGNITQSFPDVIFLDIDILGGMDGLSVLQQVRKNEKTQTTPVIVLTGMGNQRKQEFLDNGANEYYVKGEVDLDKLKELARIYTSKTA